MSERREAVILARRVLDRPYGDPDDDLAVLARQFLRALDEIDAVRRSEETTEKLRARTYEILEAERDEHRFALSNALADAAARQCQNKHSTHSCTLKPFHKGPHYQPPAIGALDGTYWEQEKNGG